MRRSLHQALPFLLVLFILLLCGTASAYDPDPLTLSDSDFVRMAGVVPVYGIRPDGAYTVSSLSAALGRLESCKNDLKNITKQKADDFAEYWLRIIREDNPQGTFELSYKYDKTTVSFYGFPASGAPEEDPTDLSGITFNTEDDNVFREYTVRAHIEVTYVMSNFKAENISNMTRIGWPYEDVTIYNDYTVAIFTTFPADRYAYVQANWDYPGEDRDLPALHDRYSGFRDLLDASQEYNYPPEYGEGQLSDWGLNPFRIHTSGRREHDIVYFFYSGRGDSGGLILTNGWQEEYVPFSTFASQIAAIPCNVVLVLDVIAEKPLTAGDISAFNASCAAISSAGKSTCVLGSINDLALNPLAHLHWESHSECRYVDGAAMSGESGLFYAGLCRALGADLSDSPSGLSLEMIRAVADSEMRKTLGLFPGFSYRVCLTGPDKLKAKTTFYPISTYGPRTSPVPELIVPVPQQDKLEELLGKSVYMVDVDEPTPLDSLFTVDVLPSDAFCRCWTCEVLGDAPGIVFSTDEGPFALPAGKARVELRDGQPVLTGEEPGLVTLRLKSAVNPELYQDVQAVIFRKPIGIQHLPPYIILSAEFPSAPLTGMTFPSDSWPGISFESLAEQVEISQVLPGLATVTAAVPEGADIVRLQSSVDEGVIDLCAVIIAGTPLPEAEYVYAEGAERLAELLKAGDRRETVEYFNRMKGAVNLYRLVTDQIIRTGLIVDKPAPLPNSSILYTKPGNTMLPAAALSGPAGAARSDGNEPDLPTGYGYTGIASRACANLTDVVYAGLGRPLRVIRSDAFAGNTSLKYMMIPSNVEEIGENALPSGVEIAGDAGSCAESYAASAGLDFTVVSVTMPESAEALAGAMFIPQIEITPAWLPMLGVQWTSSDEAVLTIRGDGRCMALREGTATLTALVGGEYPASCTVTVRAPEKTVLPDGTEVIEDEAFRHSGAVFVVLSGRCAAFGEYAFADCEQLAAVEFPASVADNVRIPENAFSNSPNVTFLCPAGSGAARYAEAHGIPWGEPDPGSGD